MTDIADEWSLMDVFGPSAKRRQLRLVLGVLGAMALLGSLRTPSPMAAKEPTASDIHDITDEEYYAMPQMYELDEYYGCLVRGGVYCFGLFQLEAPPGNELFHMIQVRQTRSTTPCPSCTSWTSTTAAWCAAASTASGCSSWRRHRGTSCST
ncbi:uncharacterized protein LOC121727678 [Aricia agestis]|uniref:uncharacterized protein LOC121727678 n=1 Tax=Aricia agestis TaxID=91739 RepID=UPI001C206BBE|nr:uncharacterized protein LOC121727678 [Aricia agestis]